MALIATSEFWLALSNHRPPDRYSEKRLPDLLCFECMAGSSVGRATAPDAMQLLADCHPG